jgi:hypothetical protein
MHMDRTYLVQELAGQRAYCEGRSPLYAAVLRELEADAASRPAWLGSIDEAWRDRTFAVGWEMAHLLLAGMHFSALAGEAKGLAAIYPSCGGSGGDPRGAASSFLRCAPAGFWERLRDARVQTNEVDRSVAWMLAAAAAFGARAMPFNLVELGASAGLNLVGDHLPHACRFTSDDGARAEPPAGWDRIPHPILTRTGLDLLPRRLAEAEDRLWLKACVWADDLPRLERLDRATEVFLRMETMASGPRLEHCSFADAPEWLLENRPRQAAAGLLVFNSIATIYLGEDDYRALQRGMARALAPWEDRAVWVEYERARGATDGPLELRIHRSIKGELRTHVVASGAPRPTAMRFHEVTPWQLN